MRVNHVGEVCAQALYQSQAMTARNSVRRVKRCSKRPAEENDHLDWCEKRLDELGGRTSLLNPLCGMPGRSLSAPLRGLQVIVGTWGLLLKPKNRWCGILKIICGVCHPKIKRSRAIVEQMKIDEGEHATAALAAGGSSHYRNP